MLHPTLFQAEIGWLEGQVSTLTTTITGLRGQVAEKDTALGAAATTITGLHGQVDDHSRLAHIAASNLRDMDLKVRDRERERKEERFVLHEDALYRIYMRAQVRVWVGGGGGLIGVCVLLGGGRLRGRGQGVGVVGLG